MQKSKKCISCKGDHSAFSRECPKWKLEKRVQQIKVERGNSFPDTRKAVLSEQSANISSERTAASIVSSATSITSKVTKKNTTSVSIQTDLTWPEGTDSPVPVNHNGKSQTTQTYKTQDNTKPGNTTSPSLPPRTSKAGNAATFSTGKSGQGDPNPPPSTSKSFPSKNVKPRINRPLHIQMTRSLCFRGMGCWMWRAGATRSPSNPRVLLLSCLFLSNGTYVVCRPTERSLAYCYLNMIQQPFAYKKLYSIVTKQLLSKNIHIMVFLQWKIMALCMVVWVYLSKTQPLTNS